MTVVNALPANAPSPIIRESLGELLIKLMLVKRMTPSLGLFLSMAGTLNAFLPMYVTERGKATEVSAAPSKAESPMTDRPSLKLKEDRAEQLLKAAVPISRRVLSGMETVVNVGMLANAYAPIDSRFLGRVTEVSLVFSKAPLPAMASLVPMTRGVLPPWKIRVVSLELANAPLPM